MGTVAGVELRDTRVEDVTRLYNGRTVKFGVRVLDRKNGALYEEWLGFGSAEDARAFAEAEAKKLIAGVWALVVMSYAAESIGDAVLS